MITWIKFSERQPEKRGEYLVCRKGIVFLGRWITSLETPYWLIRDSDSAYENLNGKLVPLSGDYIPDYWTEINLPGIEKRSGITVLRNDPSILNAITKLVYQMGANPEKWGHPNVAHRVAIIIVLLYEVTDWMKSPAISLYTKALRALNNLMSAAIEADGSAETSS